MEIRDVFACCVICNSAFSALRAAERETARRSATPTASHRAHTPREIQLTFLFVWVYFDTPLRLSLRLSYPISSLYSRLQSLHIGLETNRIPPKAYVPNRYRRGFPTTSASPETGPCDGHVHVRWTCVRGGHGATQGSAVSAATSSWSGVTTTGRGRERDQGTGGAASHTFLNTSGIHFSGFHHSFSEAEFSGEISGAPCSPALT